MRKQPKNLIRAAIILLGVAAIIIVGANAQMTSDDVSVVGYDLKSSKRVGRTTFEYNYAVDVRNGTSSDIENVSVTVSTSSANALIVDGEADVGSVASGDVASSSDTITVRVDRRSRFNPSTLDDVVSYNEIVQPPTLPRVTEEQTGISTLIPDEWTAKNDTNYVGFFSPTDVEEELPASIVMYTYNVPMDLTTLPFQDAVMEVVLIKLEFEDIVETQFHSGGVEIVARTFGGNHFFIYNPASNQAVEFVSRHTNVFSTEPFLTMLAELEF